MDPDPIKVAAEVAVYIAIVSAGVPIVWAVAEAMGKLLGVSEMKVAIGVGPLYAVFFLLFGWLPVLPVALYPQAEVAINFAWAALSGLASSGGAKVLNDKLMKPQGFKLPQNGKEARNGQVRSKSEDDHQEVPARADPGRSRADRGPGRDRSDDRLELGREEGESGGDGEG